MTPKNLIDEIETAFAEVSYPGDDELTECDAVGREHDETYQLLCGKTWRTLSVNKFMQGDTPIPDLSPQAFHYYMPALLIASLDKNDDFDVSGSLAFFLSPASAKKIEGDFPYNDTEMYNKRMSLFNKAQRIVLIRVLEEYVARGWETENDIRQTVEVLRRSPDDA